MKTDSDELEHVVRCLDVAATGAASGHDVDRALRASGESLVPTTALGMFGIAFIFRERGPQDDASVPPFRSLFGHEDGGPFSLAPNEVPETALALWEFCADRVTSPMAQARLHDLCFVVRRGDVGAHGRAAFNAYLSVADQYPSTGDQTNDVRLGLGAGRATRRALELARTMGNRELARGAMDAALRHARYALGAGAGPGTLFGFLRPVVRDIDPLSDIDDLLAQARRRHKGDVFQTQSVIDLQLVRARDQAETDRLHREQIQCLIDATDGDVSPANSMIHLQGAIELAERHHLFDLREDATRRLQRLAGSDLGLVSQVVSVPVDPVAVEGWRSRYLERECWQDALSLLLADGPPSGHIEENRLFVEQLPEISPLVYLTPIVQLTSDGHPRKRPSQTRIVLHTTWQMLRSAAH
jgi:hypothetical protein